MDILALRRRAAEALSEEQRSGALRALLAQQATAAGAPQDTAVTQVAFLQQYVETAVADLDAAWAGADPSRKALLDWAAALFLSIPADAPPGLAPLIERAYVAHALLMSLAYRSTNPTLAETHNWVRLLLGDASAAALDQVIAQARGASVEELARAREAHASTASTTAGAAPGPHGVQFYGPELVPPPADMIRHQARNLTAARAKEPLHAERLITTRFEGWTAEVSAMAIDGKGRVVVAGWLKERGGRFRTLQSGRGFVVRYGVDGSLDQSFGQAGCALFDGPPAEHVHASRLHALSPDADDGLVIAATLDTTAPPWAKSAAVVRLTSDGVLDRTFGTGGWALAGVSYDTEACGLALQADGRAIVCGAASHATRAMVESFALARFTREGAPDPTFGTSGRADTSFLGGLEKANAVVVHGDAIVAAGRVAAPGSRNGSFAVAKYNANGILDATFGLGGFVQTTFAGPGFSTDDEARAVAVGRDGRIVAVGRSEDGGRSSLAVACFRPDGTLDDSFGVRGRAILSLADPAAPNQHEANAVVIDALGGILIAGRAAAADRWDMLLVRLRPDGSLDDAFGDRGVILADFFGMPDDAARAMVVRSDAIVLAGTSGDGVAVVRLARAVASHPLDDRFTGANVMFAPIAASARGRAMALQRDGRIVVAGEAQADSGSLDVAVVRFEPDGAIDRSFGSDGVALLGFPDGDDSAVAVRVLGDGTIAIGGESEQAANGGRDLLIMRLTAAGRRDERFQGQGVVLGRGFFGGRAPAAVAIDEDGSVVAAAALTAARAQLARFRSDGVLDTRFGTGGYVDVFSSTFDVEARALALQSDGKIILVAMVRSGGQARADVGVARFNADGTIDATFGADGWSVIDLEESDDIPHAVALLADGRIAIAGEAVFDERDGRRSEALVLCLAPDGTADRSFNGWGGRLIRELPGAALALATEPRGDVVVAGFVTVDDRDRLLAFRCRADGSLDPAFGAAGLARIDAGGDGAYARAVLMHPSGNIFVAGSSRAARQSRLALARIDNVAPASGGLTGRG